MLHRPRRCDSLLCVLVLLATACFAQTETPRTINLPTSKTLTVPSPGRLGSTNGFVGNLVVSPDGHYAALLNDGYGTQETLAHQSIAVLDLKTNQLTDFPDARFGEDAHQSFFVGLGFSSDGRHLYASVGSITRPTGKKPADEKDDEDAPSKTPDLGNGIAVYSFSDGKVAPERFIPIPLQPLAGNKKIPQGLTSPTPHMAIPYPAGFAVIADSAGTKASANKDKLLIANNFSDNAILLDVATGKTLETFNLSTNDVVPAAYPYTCVATKDGRRGWCSLWNSSQVAELDLTSGKVVRRIKLSQPLDSLAPGSHPTAMLLSPNEKLLYVPLSNVDKIAVAATDTGMPFAFLNASAGQRFAGAYPTALTQSSDGKRLFVADSALDAVAVLEAPLSGANGNPESELGPSYFIPTDWYPSALAVVGDDLLIATAKGEGTRANKGYGKTDFEVKKHRHEYIATLLHGSVARLNIPDTLKKLPQFTDQVETANRFHSDAAHDDPGTIVFAGGKNPIKHVIYVIKENRTFDQILGDLGVGDGDPSLVMYGADITPNEHALARQFGVLDNFYDSGEVSGDGHVWSTAAINSDYNEKTWQLAYRGKERTYDFMGQVGDEFPLEHNIPDVDDPGTGFLWDDLASHHFSYRFYGEFLYANWCNGFHADASATTPPGVEQACSRKEVQKGGELAANVGSPHGGKSPWPWPVPLFDGVRPSKAALREHFDPLYPDFNPDYPDQLRADEFLNEFDAFVRARQEHAGPELQLPAFSLLYLPNDHTGGTRPGHARPAANVADNDLALGRVVEAVSHSPYWDDTAIFVVEDDAQDGGDHVDAHRSIALVISKYSPGSSAQPHVEHGFYTTVNMIHTMETLIGLPPMNQNDAYAPVMTKMFSGAGDQPPYMADDRNLKSGMLYEINQPQAPGAKASLQMDFSRPDAASAAELNEVLWRDQKGDAPVPAAKHAVIAGY